MNRERADAGLVEFVEALSEFCRAHPSLRQMRFLHGSLRENNCLPDVEWTDFTGGSLHWRDPGLSNLCLTIRCLAEAAYATSDGDAVSIAFNRSGDAKEVTLATANPGWHRVRGIDSSLVAPDANEAVGAPTELAAKYSVVAFACQPDGAGA